jgi:hypothetical protein
MAPGEASKRPAGVVTTQSALSKAVRVTSSLPEKVSHILVV